MANFLKKLFGSKADRDVKQITPILNQVLAAYDRLDKLSDDDLRAERFRSHGNAPAAPAVGHRFRP